MSLVSAPQTIALLGGTGPEGTGLAARFAAAGERVVIGSRVADRAQSVAHELEMHLAQTQPEISITGTTNEEAARAATLVFLCVPYSGQTAVLSACGGVMSGKIAVSVVAPIAFVKG